MNEKEERENWNSNSLPLVLCVQESTGACLSWND